VLIGSGSTVNGGTIGDYCIVGSGAVILEGAEIPSYSMVTGVPGKIQGKIRERHIQLIRGVVEDYIEKARIYRSDASA
jgi:carbonic anhydrase/acetyltransferase-like protein (isoleucine patch superfamily)